MQRSQLLCKFDHIATSKNLSGDELKKEAQIFWKWATSNRFVECPFPEWLIKFHLGEWCPFEEEEKK